MPSAAPQAPPAAQQPPPPAGQQTPPQHSAAQPRHQQPSYRPSQAGPPPAPNPRFQRREGAPDITEQTTILSRQQMDAAREQATHDPGVGDFFGPPSGPNSTVPNDAWPPEPLEQGSAAPAQPFADAFGGAGEPFGGAGYVSDESSEAFGPSQRSTPVTGWRKAVSVMTFGLVKPGPSAKQLRAEEEIRAITASLLDVFVVAFVNSKGGVGKTTMAVSAGNAIARERGDRVIVVDVDTDLGNLSARFEENGGPKANIEALAALPSAGSYQNVRVFTVQNSDRLEMLSSQNDPRSNYRLNIQDFESAMKILRAHYNVILLDCGTSITSNLFPAIAKQVNCLVVVSSNDAPGLNGAWRTLGWLEAHGFSNLLPRTVIALNANSGDKPAVDMKEAEARFREKVEEVVTVPYDAHLHEGGFISFDRMTKRTRKAVTGLAASIARYYPTRQPRQRPEELGRY
ncbi:AAA family ATPase [Mycobacterium avium subsp. hominissuis]|uniref:MinD/ParA family ATP-binding protein n=1 Tax=Mycobacterium avium TaxID=1764 RepID=UPI0026667C0E|nr:AAA family ATPase [Mycobacterium avium]MDO2394808.1 AAA family ATPase [Mycobacterium avium subsp. hominissuis]